MLAKLAIVGRPNVGKSTIFNRIIGTRLAITDDQPGITRDRVYAKGSWLGREFACIDTGGIELSDAPFLVEIREQAQLAIDEADVILFVTDVRTGITDDDRQVAKILYQSNKPIILAVNKVDDQKFMDLLYEFYALGLDEPYPISGIHGIGIGDLLDAIIAHMPDTMEDNYTEDTIRFSIIGRPNVGKSSLMNALLGEARVIVSDIAGTTRDAIDTSFKKEGKNYVAIDTAGIRKRGKIYENAEKYSVFRALNAMERSDVLLLVIDAETGIIEQDKHIGSYIQEYGKAAIIVVNKWDAIEKDNHTMKRFEDEIRAHFQFLSYVPIVFVSAKDNKRVHTLFPELLKVFENHSRRITTHVLNDSLADMVAMNPTPVINRGRAKFMYVTQVSVKPPTFVLFVNNPIHVHFSYLRYLENQFREYFNFEGTPIKLILRKKDAL